MKNITNFDDFKNHKFINSESINEAEGSRDFKTSINDPFVNVAGNFAGADKTLVGSAVIKLFNFVKRKGYQALMRTWLKPALYDAYMKGLIKYALVYNKNLPKEKTDYTIYMIANIDKQDIEKSEDIVVNFLLDGKNNFDIGSEVKKISGNVDVVDGYYQIKFTDSNTIFKCESLKVTKINPDELEPKQEETETEIKEEVQTDIEKLFIKIKDEIDNNKTSVELLNQYLLSIDEAVKWVKEGLSKIKERLNSEKEASRILQLQEDQKIYQKDLDDLIKVENLINEGINKLKNNTSSTNTNPTIGSGTENVKNKVAVTTESLIYEEVNPVNVVSKTGTGVIGTSRKDPKVSGGNIDLDENEKEQIRLLKKNGADIKDRDFLNQFNNEQVKKDATKIALDYRSEIIRIQLAAERFFINNKKEVDRKLQNSWLKMVQNVKQQFTPYFEIEQLDPQSLRNKLGEDVSKLESMGIKDNKTITNVSNDLNSLALFGTNKVLKDLVKPKALNSATADDLCFMTINNHLLIVSASRQKIGKGSYYIYRIVAFVSDQNKFFSVKDEKEIKSLIILDLTKLPAILSPKNKMLSGGYNYVTTYLIYPYATSAPSTNGSTNSFVPLYLYTKDKIENLIDGSKNFDSATCLFTSIEPKSKIEPLLNPNKQVINSIKNMITISTPNQIQNDKLDIFNVKESFGKLSFGNITKTSGYENIEDNWLKK